MDWVKANVPIVACSGVILLIIPAAWLGSSMWNGRIRTGREQAAAKSSSALDALKVSYVLPAVSPGGPTVTLPMDAPNPAATTFFLESRKKISDEVGQVVSVADEINRGDHKPLIDGLFPNPADKLLTLTFFETLVGKGEKPSAYQDLLKSINAGGPADPNAIAEILNEERTQQMDRKKAESGTDKLTTDEETDLSKRLAVLRLSEYQRHARSVSVYALPDFFPSAPRAIPAEPPDVATCFRLQFDYWVVADLLKAIDLANHADGNRTSVDKSVVKRIERITLEPMATPQAPGAGQQPMSAGAGTSGPTTLTGRHGGGMTALYDLRSAELWLVVSSAKLPELLGAISRTNFMTVTSIEFDDADPWTDLEQGYFYGTEHVVRAHLTVETVWLRSWTMPLTPDSIKDAMKASEEAAAPPPPPPPPPKASSDDTPKRSTPKKPPPKRPGKGGARGGGGD